jgi:maleate isomerase
MTANVGMAGYKAALGFVTPSANLVVERVTTAVLADFPEVSGHFSRTPVFGAADLHPNDYDWDGMMSAAHLLAQARPDRIVWSGSKGATLGFAADRAFCARVTAETGILATTSTLALHEALTQRSMRRIAVVSPYSTAYQKKLVAGFEREGYVVAAEAHADLADNLSFATVEPAAIEGMCAVVAEARPEAIVTWCTNFPAAYQVRSIERRFGVPVFDSVTLAVWHGLAGIGALDGRGESWGGLFAGPAMAAGAGAAQ